MENSNEAKTERLRIQNDGMCTCGMKGKEMADHTLACQSKPWRTKDTQQSQGQTRAAAEKEHGGLGKDGPTEGDDDGPTEGDDDAKRKRKCLVQARTERHCDNDLWGEGGGTSLNGKTLRSDGRHLPTWSTQLVGLRDMLRTKVKQKTL